MEDSLGFDINKIFFFFCFSDFHVYIQLSQTVSSPSPFGIERGARPVMPHKSGDEGLLGNRALRRRTDAKLK